MQPTTTDDVLDLLHAYVDAAGVGAALEWGLFWRLVEKAESASSLARALSVPEARCICWLDLLTAMGMLERRNGEYLTSAAARAAITDSYSPQAWAFLAQEAREQYPAVRNLTEDMRSPGSVWAAQGLASPDYVAKMAASPERTRQFTRMLYEIHQDLAEKLAATVDMTGVRRLMDLGGGSGVISLALLRRHTDLSAQVVDIGNVCIVGAEIAAEHSMTERLSYYPTDFLRSELPSGFDVVLECDVGVFNEALFRRLRAVLRPRGRLIIVHTFSHPPQRKLSRQVRQAFLAALDDPDWLNPTVTDVEKCLQRVGFEPMSLWALSPDWVVIEALRD